MILSDKLSAAVVVVGLDVADDMSLSDGEVFDAIAFGSEHGLELVLAVLDMEFDVSLSSASDFFSLDDVDIFEDKQWLLIAYTKRSKLLDVSEVIVGDIVLVEYGVYEYVSL